MNHTKIIDDLTKEFPKKILDIEVQQQRITVYFKLRYYNELAINEFAKSQNLWCFKLRETTSMKVVFYNKPL